MHWLSAVRAAQVDVANLAAGVVAVEDRRACLPGEPLVRPAHHHHQHVDELSAFVGEDVLVARSAVVGATLKDFLSDKVGEPLGQDLA